MHTRRVVITGMGAVSPFGKGSEILFSSLLVGKSGIVRMDAYEGIAGLTSQVAGPVTDVDITEIPRKNRRSMSRMSVYALLAAQEAAAQAGLTEALLAGGRLGVVMGSTVGSVDTMEEFFTNYLQNHSIEQVKAMLFFRIMGHSVAANVAQSLGVTGRTLAPSAACSTGCQAVGLGYEAIAAGKQDIMLCGGADELHPLTTATFDIMTAASNGFNDAPQSTPRPFDTRRDGVVCSEGAGVLVLESLESALTRRVPILAEVAGFSSTTDPSSIANPDPHPVYACMQSALEQAKIAPSAVAYVNAHATGTAQGDEAECKAIAELFGTRVPVSSLKGHLGHTMAASGALELIACVQMMKEGVLIPTRNLDDPAPECKGVYLLRKNTRLRPTVLIKNNFALGGVNCSVVLRGCNDRTGDY